MFEEVFLKLAQLIRADLRRQQIQNDLLNPDNLERRQQLRALPRETFWPGIFGSFFDSPISIASCAMALQKGRSGYGPRNPRGLLAHLSSLSGH